MKLSTFDNQGNKCMPSTYPDIKNNRIILSEDIIYKIRYLKRNYSYSINRNFAFDGASIPRLFWSTTGSPYTPRFIRAALLHDFLYRFNSDNIGKKLADIFLYEILRIDQVTKYTAWKMHKGVRLFGRRSWKNWRKSNDN